MKKILIIEDHPDMRENIAEILELASYCVYKAENGKKGIELAQQHRPDLIICDIMMPVMDGYAVLHILHQSPECSQIPIIFLTAKSERSDIRKGMEEGADDYVTKPFDDMELLRAVESRLNRADRMQKSFDRSFQGVQDFFQEASKWVPLDLGSVEKRIKKFSKKECIYRSGASPVFLYYLVKGKVKEIKTHEYGKELITNVYKPGDFFGYTALFNDSNYEESTETIEETELIQILKSDVAVLLNQNVTVMHQFIKMLANHVKEKEAMLVNQAYSSVRKRTAKALYQLFQRFNTQDEERFSMQLSREDLAQMVGTATESLIRTLSDFKAEGLIGLKGSWIQIIKPEQLNQIKG